MIVITREDLLIGDDGIPLGGTRKPDPACPHCAGKGIVDDCRPGWGTWTCLCAAPSDPTVAAYWRERLNPGA